MKILLRGSGGSFSLLIQSCVVLMEKPGLQEMMAKDKVTLTKTAGNLGLYIFDFLGKNDFFYLFTMIVNIVSVDS
jgi:hypothetical protein